MAHVWIFIFVIELVKWATCEYHCTLETAEITCSGIDAGQLSEEIFITSNKTNTSVGGVDKSDIVTLNITNGIVSTFSSRTFEDFTKLESLYVTDSKVSKLEDNAFSHSLDLTHLYLNNNTLAKFNIESFTPENGLTVLDLASNRLNDLSDFNVSYFPKLNFLNLANNGLSYLPVNLLTKLQEHNQFYLVADNNPWDCNDSNWSGNLTDKLINAFCPYQTVDGSPRVGDEKTSEATKTTNIDPTSNASDITQVINGGNTNDLLSIQEIRDGYDGGNIGGTKSEGNQTRDIEVCEEPNCAKCSFYFCLYWLCGGIWLGIIIGNIPKLMTLLCKKSSVYSDHSTQCEQSFADQYMVSGYHLDFNRKSGVDSSKSSRQRTTPI